MGNKVQQKVQQIFSCIMMLFIMVIFAGCSTINKQHPMLVTQEIKDGDNVAFASVYFIRPKPLKPKGVADKPITVEYQDKTILTVEQGGYTLLRIKPSEGFIKVNSETKFINKLEPIKVWRARHYKFIEGKTYFIYLKRVNEEFRGIFYEPQPIDFENAKKLAEDCFATGEARGNPIDKLVNISEPPASAFDKQPPALPENIYKPEPYLK